MVEPIKSFREFVQELNEDVAGNSAGGGAFAGLGVGAKGEPGVARKTRNKMLRRNIPAGISEENADGALTLTIPVFIRALEIAREVLDSDDELHIFVEKIMDLNVTGPIQMTDVEKVYSHYKD